MRTSYIIIIIAITAIIFIALLVFSFPHREWEGSLASPNLIQMLIQKPTPNPTPSSTESFRSSLKIFQFDNSTDLKKELDTVNPQVLDSDFNE